MTDDTPDSDDALDAIATIDDEAEQAITELSRGPGSGEVFDALDTLEANAQELVRYAEGIEQTANRLTGGRHSEGLPELVDGADEAWEHAQTIRNLADIAAQAVDAQAEQTVGGTLEVDGQTYEVSLSPVETADDDKLEEPAD